MDRNAFDALARGFSRAGTRRAALTALAATIPGLGVARETRADRNDPKLCCRYECQRQQDGTVPVVFKCHKKKPGNDRCPGGHEGCSFASGDGYPKGVKRCSQCPG